MKLGALTRVKCRVALQTILGKSILRDYTKWSFLLPILSYYGGMHVLFLDFAHKLCLLSNSFKGDHYMLRASALVPLVLRIKIVSCRGLRSQEAMVGCS